LDKYQHIRHWVADLPKVGRSSFSLIDAKAQFPDVAEANLRNSLHRLSAAGKIRSVWRGFYAIVLPEYGLDGNIPSIEYIDQLMAYVKADYYVALLSAASLQGSSHQAPQVFQVMSDKQLRSKQISGSQLDFAFKGNIVPALTERKVVKSGYVTVSAPLLTALDLVSYPSRSGGISHVAVVLSELAGSLDFSDLDAELLMSEPRATIQRLGYLLERSLGERELAGALFEKCDEAGIRFRKTELAPGWAEDSRGYDKKWKIGINYDVEVDE